LDHILGFTEAAEVAVGDAQKVGPESLEFRRRLFVCRAFAGIMLI